MALRAPGSQEIEMSRDKSQDEGRRDSRAWLGPPGQGGERLARLFGIDSRQSVRPIVELRRASLASDRNYWLSHCEQFTVYAGGDHFGVVEGMRFESRIDRPDLLEVRCGRLGRQLVLIPVDHVEVVEPDQNVIVLQASDRAAGVREHLRLRLDQLLTPLRALLH
jgi:hypothetical protein